MPCEEPSYLHCVHKNGDDAIIFLFAEWRFSAQTLQAAEDVPPVYRSESYDSLVVSEKKVSR